MVNLGKQNLWQEVHVETTPDIQDALTNFLFELGASGVVDKDSSLVGYFSGISARSLHDQISHYILSLAELHGIAVPLNIKIDTIENRDWNAEWKKSYGPVRITDTILIRPSWHPAPADAPDIVIEIDPEMAFGTGTHETTSLTLQLLEEHVKPGFRVLDVGTGTGILAIAALKCGASQAVGFDIDPIASQTAKLNAEKNSVGSSFLCFAGTIDALVPNAFDIILANVNRSQILKLLPGVVHLLGRKGICILSGILETEEDLIRTACQQLHVKVQTVRQKGEWLAVHAQKEDNSL